MASEWTGELHGNEDVSSAVEMGALLEKGPSRPRRAWYKIAVPTCSALVAVLGIAGLTSTDPGRAITSSFAGLSQKAEVEEKDEEEVPALPTLFCWSHMQAGSDEEPLIRLQLVRRASIFACDQEAVISSEQILLGEEDGGKKVWTWVNEVPPVPMGQNGVAGQTTDSFLNTQVFLLAWETLMNSGIVWDYDFTVKVDPDAVFFPDRLRTRVQKHVGDPVYFPNCGKWGPNTLLYGSLEVFSKQALGMYHDGLETCKAMPWQGWGEDYYMQKCMDKLGVGAVPDLNQVGDSRCVAAGCDDWTKVAFHDFKSPEDWYDCFQTAIGESGDKVEKETEDQVTVIFRK